jgi:pimeloyl-ACP methyl ester carboxylesterase
MSAYQTDTLAPSRRPSPPLASVAADARSPSAGPPSAVWPQYSNLASRPHVGDDWRDKAIGNASARRMGVASAVSDLLARVQLRVLGLVAPQTAARRGVDMFCTPTPHNLVEEGDTVAGAQLTLLQVDGHELATYVWGDPQQQPYVLITHDWSDHALGHLAWVAALRTAGYAVVAFDQQAHGRSSGNKATLPDFVCNLLAVGWRYGRAAAVIGHGLGGAAAAVALSHGLEADRAILVAAQADPEDAVSRFADCMGLAGPVRRRMIAMLETRTGVEMDTLQAHRTVPKIGRPALVVHDIDDAEVPWSEGERYARYWPHARLLTTTGLGHQRIANNAQVIASSLRFLQGKTVGECVVSSPNLPYGLA